MNRRVLACIVLSVAALAATVAGPATGAPESAGAGKPAYKSYASCRSKPPFKAARRCGYDGPRLFKATDIIRSNVGKRLFKACFRAFGPAPVGGGHACAKVKGARSYKAYPFKLQGVRQRFSVSITWFAKKPGSKQGYSRVAHSFFKARP